MGSRVVVGAPGDEAAIVERKDLDQSRAPDAIVVEWPRVDAGIGADEIELDRIRRRERPMARDGRIARLLQSRQLPAIVVEKWWRRRELNPRPRMLQDGLLRV